MGVTTTKTNKPLNPRGNDQSPLAFNRAKLYSGKALDFDGVNDYVDLDGFTMAGNVATIVFQAKFENDNYLLDLNPQRFVIRNTSSEGFRVFNSDSFAEYGETKRSELGFYSIVSDGTTQRAYYNGVQLGSDKTIIALDWSSATNVKIASNNTGTNNFFDGQLSNFKIFNTALTAAQVADLYNNPEKVVPTGVDNTALKLWLPMMEGAGTTAYDGSAPLTDYVTNGDFSDGTNNWTASNATLSVEGGALKITSTGGNRPQANQTITGLTIGRKYLLSAVARVGTTPYNMEIEIAGIGASGSYNKTTNSTDTYIYYEFTASSTFHQIQAKIDNDPVPIGETGYFDDIKLLDLGNYGTINGATWVQGVGAPVAQSAVIDWNKMVPDHTNEILVPQGLTAGRDLLGNLFENVRKQGALNLDGNSWAEVHDNESLDITTAITLEVWIKYDGIGDRGVLGKWYGNNKESYLLYTATNHRAVLYIFATATSSVASSTIMTTGDWYHIVGTYDGSNMKVYVNGTSEGTVAKTGNVRTTDKEVEIGRYYDSNTYAYQDSIAQPRIYNRALTAEEVQRSYDSGKNIYTNS